MPRIATVFIEDFDRGVFESIGGELMEIERDGESIQVYVLSVPGVRGADLYRGNVPIVFQDSEDAYQSVELPYVLIGRNDMSAAMNRYQPGTRDYIMPAGVGGTITTDQGVTGPAIIETKGQAVPEDFTYDIHLRARLRLQANRMLKCIGKALGHPMSTTVIYFTDSQGEERGYETSIESISNLSELGDISERMIGYTLSMRVMGELDFHDPTLSKTTPKFTARWNPKRT
jgi:hypothetical protein